MTDPPLLIYQQTRDHLLLDPRPGPRHALRVDLYPRRPSEVMASPAPDEVEHSPTRLHSFTHDDGGTYVRVDPAEFNQAHMEIDDAGFRWYGPDGDLIVDSAGTEA